jgi:hypothetical protein
LKCLVCVTLSLLSCCRCCPSASETRFFVHVCLGSYYKFENICPKRCDFCVETL